MRPRYADLFRRLRDPDPIKQDAAYDAVLFDREEALPDVVECYGLSQDDALMRYFMVQLMAFSGSKGAVKPLIRALEDPDPLVRVEACRGLDSGYRCVVVGDAPYQADYIAHLHRLAGPSTLFTGYVFGQGYRELCSNAYLFVEPSEVGGTHPALLEAMALGNCVVANDIPENREAIGDAGLVYNGRQGSAGLKPVLDHLLASPQTVDAYRARALAHAALHYRWEQITDRYEELFMQILQEA